MKDTIDREWIEEFATARGLGWKVEPVSRELVIREHQPGMFSMFQTHPEPRLIVALTLDEVLGYAALAIAAGRPGRWQTIEEQRAWVAKYAPADEREAAERQFPEKASA